jgi:minor extracellular serine protease Vpr
VKLLKDPGHPRIKLKGEHKYMKRILVVTLTLVLLLSSASLAVAQEPVEPLTPLPTGAADQMVDETSSFWFVELLSPPAAEGTSMATLRAEKSAFRANAKKAGLVYTERFAYDVLFNGLSISIERSELGKLTRIPGVMNIYPVEIIALPELQQQPEPELFTSLAMIGADIAQSELGYTGEGVRVAVMDTGIDYDHPDLGGGFGPGYRVAYGYDFVGDAYNADPTSPSYDPVPVPDPDPDDCNGHGTHVAGIIGANGNVTGVAPEVTFGAYRVFGCEGSTSSDIMLAAMELALADGMQILNMSIGSAYTWPQYPTAIAATRLVNKGMVVVASIGNNGANGLYSAGAPGLGEKVIGVASYDNTHMYLPYFTVNDRNIGYITMTYSPDPPTAGSYEVVPANLDGTPIVPGSLVGKVALVARGGGISFAVKASNAIAAGAVAVVISNNAAGVFSGTLGAPLPDPRPVVGISLADGDFIRAQTSPITMTWTDQEALFASPTGGLISSSSSYGLSPDLALKPDIGAPGGNIYSTYPLEKGGYTVMSGTSMSTPHVAGAVALLLQARPNTPSQAVRGILQNSADPTVWWGNPGLGFLDNVHRQGAGMLDIDDAILSTTKIEPGKISAGEGEAGPFTQTLCIENKAAADVTYDLSFVNALSTGGVITPSFFLSDASVVFSADTVTIPAHGIATLDATIYPATGPTYGQYGGYIVFTPQGGGQVYRVPFAGFVGDYQSIPVLTPTANDFPWLSVLYGGSFYKVTGPGDWTYTMQGDDVPYFLVHFDHQARTFRIDIYAENGKAWHRAYIEEYLPRNSTPTSFYAFAFDGTTVAGKKTYTVPDGTYYAVISVLKANGDPANPAHWETWPSPLFLIDRP